MILEKIRSIKNGRIITQDAVPEEEHWVTVKGHHILINGSGEIVGGSVPKSMQGKHLSELKKTKKMKTKLSGNKGVIAEYGFEPDSFDDMFDLDGVDEVELTVKAIADGTVSGESIMKNEKGEYIGNFDFEISDYVMSIELAVFEDKESRAKGYGKALIENAKATCKKFGIEEITLFADVTIGRYAWAKMGFDFEDEEDLITAKSGFRKYVGGLIEAKKLQITPDQQKQINSQIRKIKRAQDIAEFKIPGLEATTEELNSLVGFENQDVKDSLRMDIGKAFMLDDYGLDAWSGVLHLS